MADQEEQAPEANEDQDAGTVVDGEGAVDAGGDGGADVTDAEADAAFDEGGGIGEVEAEKVKGIAAKPKKEEAQIPADQAKVDPAVATAAATAKAEKDAADAAAVAKASADAKKVADAAAASSEADAAFDPDKAVEDVMAAMKDAKIATVNEDGTPGDPQSAEQFANDYPGVRDYTKAALKGMATAMQAVINNAVQKAMQPLAPVVAQTEQARVVNEVFDALGKSGHEDARELYASEEFIEESKKLPANVQEMLDSTNPALVAAGLTVYKALKAAGSLGAAAAADDAKTAAAKAKADAAHKKAVALGTGTLRSRSPKRVETETEEVTDKEADDLFAEGEKRE